MNVVALVDFHDNLKDVDRKRGEAFVVSRERFEQINATGVEKIGAPLVEEAASEAEPAGRSTKPRAKSSRKAAK